MLSDSDILFHGFSDTQKQGFLDLATLENYGNQDVIVKAGEPGSEMLLVVSGVVSVWVNSVKVGEARPESVLGVSTVIEPHPRTATLIAETGARVCVFERSKMLGYLETLPPALFHRFFVNAFHIHMKLIQRCEERVVQLAHELNSLSP